MEAEIATNPKIDALLMPDYNCNLKWLNSSAIPGERAFSSHVKSDRKVWRSGALSSVHPLDRRVCV